MKTIYSASAIVLVLASLGCETKTEQLVDDAPLIIDDYVVVDVRETLGTLVITPTVSGQGDLSSPSKYWVYLEGRIVATKESPRDDPSSLDSFDVQLVPGEYDLDVAVRRPLPGIQFPISFTSQKVLAEAGKTVTVEISVEIDRQRDINLGFPGFGETWDKWIVRLAEWAEAREKAYEENRVAQAMDGTLAALQESTLQPVVWIEMPEHWGGGREFDADQVRLIVAWLKSYTWEWFPVINEDGRWNGVQVPASTLAQYRRISAAVTWHRDGIDSLNKIAEKLEKVQQ